MEKKQLFKQGLKQCPKCTEPKLFSEFGKDKNRLDGFKCWCKEHEKEDRIKNKKRIEKYHKEYYEENKEERLVYQKEYTEKFPWKKTLSDIKQRCYNSKNSRYKNYGGRGIECRITVEELEKLWYRDKAWLLEKPSIDRKENDGHYEFGNCRYIELVENSGKDKRKPVLQYDLQGKFIKEWESAVDVERKLGIPNQNINKVLFNLRQTAGGFKWEIR